MGSIRRKVSVADGIALFVAEHYVDSTPAAYDKGIWDDLAEVDCGSCALSLRRESPGLPGLASLLVTLKGNSLPDAKKFFPKLARVLSIGVDLVVTYDFQSHSPTPAFTQSLTDFLGEQMEHCAARLKATALLVKDNLFEMATQSSITSFVHLCVPGLPFVMCHTEASALEFFKAAATETSVSRMAKAAPFISMVDVQEAPPPVPPGQYCIARLKPLGPGYGPVAFPEAHTFCTLPNGDVRVIQSLSQRVVTQVAPQDRGGRGKRPREDAAAAAASNTDELADRVPGAVASVKFACPQGQLRQLVGGHFHLGELVIDAESAPVMRAGAMQPVQAHRRAQQACPGPLALSLPKDPFGLSGCFGFLDRLSRRARGCSPRRSQKEPRRAVTMSGPLP